MSSALDATLARPLWMQYWCAIGVSTQMVSLTSWINPKLRHIHQVVSVGSVDPILHLDNLENRASLDVLIDYFDFLRWSRTFTSEQIKYLERNVLQHQFGVRNQTFQVTGDSFFERQRWNRCKQVGHILVFFDI